MLEKLKSYLTKQSQTYRAIVSLYKHQPLWTPVNYNTASMKGYRSNVYVFASIRQIAMSVAGVQWNLFRKQGDDMVEIQDHDLINLLNKPNPYQAKSNFFEDLVGYLMLSGNVYIEKVGTDDGRIMEIYALRPDRMEIIVGDETELIGAYRYNIAGRQILFNPAEILHLKTFNPVDDFFGMSPLHSAFQSLDHNNESRAWNVSLLQNNARPSGAMVSEGHLTDEQFDRLKEQIDHQYTGFKNAGRPYLLEGGLDWKEMGVNPKDMDWIDGQKLSAREIAIAFGVPPEMIGDSSNKTYSNYQEARSSFYQETILPLLNWIRDELNEFLVKDFGDNLFLDYDRDSMEAIQEDRDKVWDRSIKGVRGGIITVNEARRTIGYEDIDGGDDLRDPDADPDPPAEVDPQALFNSMDFTIGNKRVKKKIQLKSFNINTQEERIKYFKQFDDARSEFYPVIQRMIAEEFEREREAVLSAISSATTPEDADQRIEDLITEREDDWDELITAIYLEVARDFASNVLNEFKSKYRKIHTKQETIIDIFNDIVLGFLAEESSDKIVGITDTTVDTIRLHLREGVEAGEGIPELTRRIDSLFLDQIIPNRSETIARTEVQTASSLGSRAGAEATELEMEKEWLATPDQRTREDHDFADGQRVPFDDPYEVGGDLLMFPLDTSLGADLSNIINCRCTEVYHVIE